MEIARDDDMTATLSNVLLVLKLGSSLMSVVKLMDKGYDMHFMKNSANIINQAGKFIATATSKCDLFYINNVESANNVSCQKSELQKWHEWFGNLNKHDLNTIFFQKRGLSAY